MAVRRLKIKTRVGIVLAALLVAALSVMGILESRKRTDYKKLLATPNTDIGEVREGETTFAAYLAAHADRADYAGDPLSFGADALDEAASRDAAHAENIEGHAGRQALVGEGGEAVFRVEVPADGLYAVAVEYLNTASGLSPCEFSLLADGERPFDECDSLMLYRRFREDTAVQYDNEGNQMRARQTEQRVWQTAVLEDKRGFYNSRLKVYLTAGAHTLTLAPRSGSLAVASLRLQAPDSPPRYADYLAANPSDFPDAEPIVVESENVAYKSVTNIRPEWVNDPKTSPKAVSSVRYNAFGGTAWKECGQSATWEFRVEQTGYYTLSFRHSVPKNGVVAYRRIEIDGEVPFDLFTEYPFASKQSTMVYTMVDAEEKPIRLYLEAGDHTLTMTPKLGPARAVIRDIEAATARMDALYRSITMITASIRDASGNIVSDANRDYNLDKKIPGLRDELTGIAGLLDGAADRLLALSQDTKPEDYSSLQRGAQMLRDMAGDPERIPQMMNEYSNILISLNTAATNLTESPLYLDYALLVPGEEVGDRRKATLWDKFAGAVESLVHSFTADYSRPPGGERELSVWVSRGRDWANIINQLALEDFTSKTNIRVKINILPLLSDYMVLTSYSGGNAPDVAMGMSQGTPVDFAARGAAVDLSAYPGFEELAGGMVEGSMEPFAYRGGVYGLPETADFQVLFYRSDIFEELGQTVPSTWEELYALMPYLHENGMDFYHPSGSGGGMGLLYQLGGSYYSDDHTRSLLDSPESIAAFSQYIDLFNKYKVPLQADPFQRMRMGTIPLAVGGYDLYTKLVTAAPELSGKWAMAPYLGTPDETGTIDRSAPAALTAVVMLRSAENPDDAWEFIRWWMSKETQVAYGNEVEALLGAGSRWNTANLGAVRELGWSRSELDVLLEQWGHFKTNPTVIGSYFTDRQMLNAWNGAALYGRSPRIVLEDAVRKINKELKRKQEEFLPQ